VAFKGVSEVVARDEGGVGELAVAGAFVDKLVFVVAEDAFEVETAAAGLGTGYGREAGEIFVVADCVGWGCVSEEGGITGLYSRL
jgi:hypothetical protein